jgi:hypothetical protein
MSRHSHAQTSNLAKYMLAYIVILCYACVIDIHVSMSSMCIYTYIFIIFPQSNKASFTIEDFHNFHTYTYKHVDNFLSQSKKEFKLFDCNDAHLLQTHFVAAQQQMLLQRTNVYIKRSHHLSEMIPCAMDAAMRASNSSTGLPPPKRECVPIMKASICGCQKSVMKERHKQILPFP